MCLLSDNSTRLFFFSLSLMMAIVLLLILLDLLISSLLKRLHNFLVLNITCLIHLAIFLILLGNIYSLWLFLRWGYLARIMFTWYSLFRILVILLKSCLLVCEDFIFRENICGHKLRFDFDERRLSIVVVSVELPCRVIFMHFMLSWFLLLVLQLLVHFLIFVVCKMPESILFWHLRKSILTLKQRPKLKQNNAITWNSC